MAQTYLALDTETYWDERLHEEHRAFDPRSNRHATAVRRVMAAATFLFSIDADGRVACGSVSSWSEHDWFDDREVVKQLFDNLRQHDATPVVTFGGLATDVPVLLLTAMENGLPLPPQLLDQPGRKGPRPHLDLGLQLKGGGRTWCHLSQVLLRIGVPAGLVAAKPNVSRPRDAAEWQTLRGHVELDCLLLAIAKIAWLVAQQTPCLRFEPAAIALICGFLRRRPDHGAKELLHAYAAELQFQFGERLTLAA